MHEWVHERDMDLHVHALCSNPADGAAEWLLARVRSVDEKKKRKKKKKEEEERKRLFHHGFSWTALCENPNERVVEYLLGARPDKISVAHFCLNSNPRAVEYVTTRRASEIHWSNLCTNSCDTALDFLAASDRPLLLRAHLGALCQNRNPRVIELFLRTHVTLDTWRCNRHIFNILCANPCATAFAIELAQRLELRLSPTEWQRLIGNGSVEATRLFVQMQRFSFGDDALLQ